MPLTLSRRELNIIEYFVRNRGRSVSKAQVFHVVYSDCQADVSETVVGGTLSKLRKAGTRLGYDPILSKRFEGYTYLG